MSEVERRAILEAVARGNLSPDEAAVRLRAASHDLKPPAAGASDAAASGEPTAGNGTGPALGEPERERSGGGTATLEASRRIRVEANAGSVRIVGDPTVAVVDVDGDHEVQEEGDAVVVRCTPLRDLDLDLDLDPHSFRHGRGGFAIRNRRFRVDDLKRRLQVTVRVNPDLPLDVQVAAGALSVRGVHAPLTCDVDAGAARLHDVTGPLQAKVNAGSLSVDGRCDGETWRVSCDMGAAAVRLHPDSDVRVRASVNLGRCAVRLPTNPAIPDEYLLGDGTGLLQVDGSMSSIAISTE
jgi:hypothetical protein